MFSFCRLGTGWCCRGSPGIANPRPQSCSPLVSLLGALEPGGAVGGPGEILSPCLPSSPWNGRCCRCSPEIPNPCFSSCSNSCLPSRSNLVSHSCHLGTGWCWEFRDIASPCLPSRSPLVVLLLAREADCCDDLLLFPSCSMFFTAFRAMENTT